MKATFFLLASIGFAQTPAAWTPEFSMQVKSIGPVVPSPDGTKVAWTQTQSVMDGEHSEMLTHIFVANADGSHRIQLTRGEKSSTDPAFSPDGRMIYFLSPRSGKNNVYRIAIAGGEAEQITDFKGNLGAFELSPDAKTVAFIGYEPPADEEKNKKEKRDYRVVDANPENFSIYLIPTAANADGKRTHRRVTDGKRHVVEIAWSPDSAKIVFNHWATPTADTWVGAELSELDVATGSIRTIAPSHLMSARPIFSRDGKYLAFTKSISEPPKWALDSQIMLMNRSSGEIRALPPTYDQQAELVGFAGDRILFSENHHTRTALYEMPIDGPPRTLFEPKGIFTDPHVNANGTVVGMHMESFDQPAEAYIMALDSKSPVRISRANTDLPKLPLGKAETAKWKSKDGLDIEGLVIYPVDYQPGKRYPTVLIIHGGPTGVFTEGFIGRMSLYPFGAFSARGYVVLCPNPRGSSGYGRDFRFADYNDWGGKDYEDIQAGVDHLISTGIADPDKLAVMGWSYGGFMTSWTITQTKRFKAAVVGAGVTDLWSFTGTADIPGFIPDYFGGEPWQQFENYKKHSPITFVRNVTTPTLVLHGESDVRVPTSQGYEFYHSLKREGVLTKMVTYPRQPHGPTEPKMILDIMQRHLDWVEKYVR